ncbi:MAG: sigma-70 family RNA polymerase sigma factor [Solirubrobacteraceae bacterium]
MTSIRTGTTPDPALVAAAGAGDEDAFAQIVEPYQRELHAHCYRMLGSVYDADDALQETLLRAWRGLSGFGGRSALRSWLYTIATNVCLTQIARRPKRVLPIDYGPATDPHVQPGQPVVESIWLEPYPDETLGLEDGLAAPDACYEQREAVELAFVAALQHLAANQRAVLILREVLGFSAKEAAAMLETTVASVNSALQRARATVAERVPERSQQATLRTLGDDEIRELVDRYIDAWERCDVDAFAAMLAQDATFAMPPMSTWYRTRKGIRIWAGLSPLTGEWRWRAVRTQANGQPGLAFYAWDQASRAYLPFALNILSFRGREISNVTAFIIRSTESTDPEAYERHPEQPFDERLLAAAFWRFGLPDRL